MLGSNKKYRIVFFSGSAPPKYKVGETESTDVESAATQYTWKQSEQYNEEFLGDEYDLARIIEVRIPRNLVAAAGKSLYDFVKLVGKRTKEREREIDADSHNT